MGTEIERKFIVDSYSFLMSMSQVVGRGHALYTQITQGYLSRDPTVRVRHTSTGPHSVNPLGFITVKGPGTITRGEWEYPIPEADALDMLALCGSVLSKIRYVVPITEPGFTHLKWEVDTFTDKGLRGLWVAEIELSSPDETFPKPAWLGKEVSDDPRYTNVSLAQTRTIPDQ